MNDQYIYLWAQWGILNNSNGLTYGYDKYKIIKEHFGDLKNAWEKINISFLHKLGFGREKAERVLDIRNGINFHQLISRIENLDIQIL